MRKNTSRGERNSLYQNIGIRGKSCEQLQEKHNHPNLKTIHRHNPSKNHIIIVSLHMSYHKLFESD